VPKHVPDEALRFLFRSVEQVRDLERPSAEVIRATEEISEREVEGASDRFERLERRLGLAVLDLAQLVRREVGLLPELLQRELRVIAAATNLLSDMHAGTFRRSGAEGEHLGVG